MPEALVALYGGRRLERVTKPDDVADSMPRLLSAVLASLRDGNDALNPLIRSRPGRGT